MEQSAFASLLLRLRRAARLTQEELAARAEVGVRTVRDIESGRATRPQRSTVELLAGALGLSGPERARFIAMARGGPAPPNTVTRVDPLIGRSEDLAGLAALLEVADLVTIVGLSGVGKAALASTAATELAERFFGGVGAVRVTEASTGTELLAAAATVLGAADPEELTLWQVRDPALLVVAGADRGPVAAAELVAWLRAHTRLRILVTSRHPLGVPGEHQWALGPLEVPPPDAEGAAVFRYPATQLFLDRLRRVRSTPVTDAEAATVNALVRRLGGLPYALELAAARGRVLELPELLARTGEPPDPAGQTVREAVSASCDLLTPLERSCLCWLSVFQWRWSLEMAEALLAGHVHADGAVDVVAVVDRLLGLGLVRARNEVSPGSAAAGIGSLRMNVFGAVRQLAMEEANRQDLIRPARDQHARVMADVCARAAAEGGDGAAARVLTNYLLADVRAAMRHLTGNGLGDKELYHQLAPWVQ